MFWEKRKNLNWDIIIINVEYANSVKMKIALNSPNTYVN